MLVQTYVLSEVTINIHDDYIPQTEKETDEKIRNLQLTAQRIATRINMMQQKEQEQ